MSVPDESEKGIPEVAGPDPRPRRPRLALPPGSVDCHAHVFGPYDRFPLTLPRSYSPPAASLDDYRAMLTTMGFDRGVLVQPSVHGTDNRAMVEALHADPKRLRGVAVVDPDIDEAGLDALAAAGVRGVRINVLFAGGTELSATEMLAARIAPRGWHVQLLVDVGTMPDFAVRFGAFPCPVVVDHMGHVGPGKAATAPGFRGLLSLMEAGRAWVKLSGAYRVTEAGPPFADVAAVARDLIAANPARCVFATDWPHPAIRWDMPNDGDLVDLLADWEPDEARRRAILVDNPQRLYGFED
ncbi:amidohydrolase family protein [Phreatobacter sp.]|uniref:amidohydrolase family protein n=1 Tax=Phreatobacter sp. TaxID=1966341 RepID=UPI003F70DC15